MTIATNGNYVYVGGGFGVAGSEVTQGIARWDGTNWSSIGGISGSIPLVYSIIAHGSDVYAAGYFTNAGNVAARSIARWNGQSWSALGVGVNGLAVCMAFLGNDLYVGGYFSQAGGVNATNIARWDGTNWYAVGGGLSGNTNGFYPTVGALAVDATGELYAAGLFQFAGSLPVNNIARWDGSQWNALGSGVFSGPSPVISDIKYKDGTVYVAGSFRSASGVNATNIARWDGSSWSAMGGGPFGTNTCLAFVGNTLYTAGNFTNIGGAKALNVARWNGAAWEPVAAGAAGEISTQVSTLGVGGGYLYAGGDFIRAGNAGVLGLARWDGVEWSAVMGPRTRGAYLAAREVRVVSSDNIYIGGNAMRLIGGRYVGRIAHWDGASWDSMAGGLTGTGTVGANSIIEQGGLVYVGGSFTAAGGVSARNVAGWDGANWFPLASGLNNSVNALAFHNGQLFAGGAFTARGDGTGTLHGFAVWDGSDWQDVPTSSFWRINNVVNALVSDGINLYIGGNFLIGWQYQYPPYDGQSLDNVGRWDGANWWALGAGFTNTVNALAIQNGILYAGGAFTNSGGTTLRRIAQWDGSSWSAVGAGFTNGSVSALAATPTALYAGGSFTNTGGLEVTRIAKWAGGQWFPLGSGVSNTVSPTSSSVSGLAVHDDDVYLAGSFNRAGGKPALGMARWNETLSFAPPLPLLLRNPRWQSGLMTFDISGISSGTYSVLASTNLVDWETIHTDTAAITNYADPASVFLRQRSYRLQQP